jgi:hypothetical protein
LRQPFTDQEDEFLKVNIGKLSFVEIGARLERSRGSVYCRAITLELYRARYSAQKFSEKDDSFIKMNAGKMSLTKIARHLNRSTGSIWGRGILLNVCLDFRKRRKPFKCNGYIHVPIETKNGHGWRLEHILIIEELIGRGLELGEIVHHIDFDSSNNEPSNLYLCKNNSEHNKAHTSINILIRSLLERKIIMFNKSLGTYKLCELEVLQ